MNKGICKNSGANVRFAEIGNRSPRNAVISTAHTEAVSGENEVDCADRGVLTSGKIAVRSEWGGESRGGRSNNDDCSCIVDTGFNVVALFSFNWIRRYKYHMGDIFPKIPKIYKAWKRD